MLRNQYLFEARRQRGLTLRDVVTQSAQVAAAWRNRRFQISLSKLSQMERYAMPPTIHQACTLALLYGVPIHEVLSWNLGPVVERVVEAIPQHGPAGSSGARLYATQEHREKDSPPPP